MPPVRQVVVPAKPGVQSLPQARPPWRAGGGDNRLKSLDSRLRAACAGMTGCAVWVNIHNSFTVSKSENPGLLGLQQVPPVQARARPWSSVSRGLTVTHCRHARYFQSNT